jgi:uncharacterized Fe-S center protein
MSSSTVYFHDDVSRLRDGAAACFKIISKEFEGGKVALKIHFGEEDNTTHVRAEWLRDVTSFFDEPVFVDCNVLYRGQRTNMESHLKLAEKHGFGYIPIDILDGERGEDYFKVPLDKGGGETAKLGAGLQKYGKLIAVTHFKGHIATGFGGALKNIGMGLGSRPGKLEMHAVVSPEVKSSKCIACGTCVEACPGEAITLDGKALIDSGKCIGCARCIAVCPQGAIDISWDLSDRVNKILMGRIAEYALAALRGREWWFINFLTDITYDCDCLPGVQHPLMDDIGILLGRDPVAVDQASIDLVKERNRGGDPFLAKHGVDGSHMLEYAEKLGIGVREYGLREITRI